MTTINSRCLRLPTNVRIIVMQLHMQPQARSTLIKLVNLLPLHPLATIISLFSTITIPIAFFVNPLRIARNIQFLLLSRCSILSSSKLVFARSSNAWTMNALTFSRNSWSTKASTISLSHPMSIVAMPLNVQFARSKSTSLPRYVPQIQISPWNYGIACFHKPCFRSI